MNSLIYFVVIMAIILAANIIIFILAGMVRNKRS